MRKCPGNGRWSDASRTDVTDPGGHEGGGVCEITAPPPVACACVLEGKWPFLCFQSDVIITLLEKEGLGCSRLVFWSHIRLLRVRTMTTAESNTQSRSICLLESTWKQSSCGDKSATEAKGSV